MKAIEFKSKLSKNRILIPKKIQSELQDTKEKDVLVILLFDDSDMNVDLDFKKIVAEQFAKGYADSDSIYDNY
jgi:DNA-binding transcriptional regulator/RsmH inhibitor MraZ